MKRVALINDLSGFGKCSLTAAIPVISVMGIQACPLPTAVLTAQTGFSSYYCDDFTDRMDNFTNEWKKMQISFDGIYSGFLASPLQIEKVLNFLEHFEKDNTIYLADPVMGDDGQEYDIYSNELLEGMKKLTKRASVITPNLTELCLLTGEDYFEVTSHKKEVTYIEYIEKICKGLLKRADRKQTIMVTGIVRPDNNDNNKEMIGSLAVSCENSFYLETPYIGRSFSGTGDLFASVVCGSLLQGMSAQTAIKRATDFLQTAIEDAANENIESAHGVQFEKYLSRLI